MKSFLAICFFSLLSAGCVPVSPPNPTATGTTTRTATVTATRTATSTASSVETSPRLCVPSKSDKFQAVDMSVRVDAKFADALVARGICVVARYYDHTNETIRNKTLNKAEVDILHSRGIKIVVVFQHNNRWECRNGPCNTFNVARGKQDALRSLELAKALGQPVGSTIYLGVDFDASTDQLVEVKKYFAVATPILRAAGYDVGVYGSGLSLRLLKAWGLVDKLWLSMSTGFRESKNFTAWDMKQQAKETMFGGKGVDFNYIQHDVGAW